MQTSKEDGHCHPFEGPERRRRRWKAFGVLGMNGGVPFCDGSDYGTRKEN
jgi:hypothetical protein